MIGNSKSFHLGAPGSFNMFVLTDYFVLLQMRAAAAKAVIYRYLSVRVHACVNACMGLFVRTCMCVCLCVCLCVCVCVCVCLCVFDLSLCVCIVCVCVGSGFVSWMCVLRDHYFRVSPSG